MGHINKIKVYFVLYCDYLTIMDKQKITLVIILAIFVTSIIWIAFSDQPDKDAASIPDVVEVRDGISYTNTDLGFEIELPQGFTYNEAYINQTLGPGREIHGVEFRIPASLSTGTNLSSDSHMAVERLSNSTCEPETFLLDPRNTETIKLGENTFVFAQSSDAGASNYYEDMVYITSKGEYCYALRYFIHSTSIGVYDPGTVLEFDRTGLLANFNKIATTFKIR